MEAEEEMNMRTRSNATQESQQNKILDAKDSSDDRVRGDSKEDEKNINNPGKNRDCSIDIIKGDANVVSRNSESTNAERICRICHFGDESSSEGSELIELGCDCKGELVWSHQHCAEAWFWQKGDRILLSHPGRSSPRRHGHQPSRATESQQRRTLIYQFIHPTRHCEICSAIAKNINNKSTEDISLFLMEWNEMRLVVATLDDSQASSRRCKQYFCKFLAICMVLAFLLPWFFRGIRVL